MSRAQCNLPRLWPAKELLTNERYPTRLLQDPCVVSRAPATLRQLVDLVSRVGITAPGMGGPIVCAYCFTDGEAYWRTDEHVARVRAMKSSRVASDRIVVNLEIDHIVPVFRGGEHHESNMAFACDRCNGSKSSRLLSEWGGPQSIRRKRKRYEWPVSVR